MTNDIMPSRYAQGQAAARGLQCDNCSEAGVVNQPNSSAFHDSLHALQRCKPPRSSTSMLDDKAPWYMPLCRTKQSLRLHRTW